MDTTKRPRVSVVKYLNTAPLIWGMLKGDQQGKYDLDFTSPAKCADDLCRREATVGIVPSIEYQRMDGLRVLPGCSIASKGKVKSVLLLSKVPVEKVETVALDNSSRTSVALVQVLLQKFYSRPVSLTPAEPDPQRMLQSADAALLIGDPALTFDGHCVMVYDLAAEWKKFTGLPFVFAVWAGHEDSGLGRFCADFEASRDYGLAHIDDIASEYAPRLGLAHEALTVYLKENIDYSLDEENRKGLELFYRLAHEIGLIPGVKEIQFA
ncbi:MAG TPA: menaquinone biosynthesis protein [Terriglobia bacterium]|nr:menaquinone biosynthesis protein [Terriglobia bacterium]